MSQGLTIWLDSGANIHSKMEQNITWDELGLTEKEWDKMKPHSQEKLAKDIAFAFSDWGFVKQEGDTK
jgi:hypothetical protein